MPNQLALCGSRGCRPLEASCWWLVLARSELLVNPSWLIPVGVVGGCRRRDRCDGRCGRGGRGWHRHRWWLAVSKSRSF